MSGRRIQRANAAHQDAKLAGIHVHGGDVGRSSAASHRHEHVSVAGQRCRCIEKELVARSVGLCDYLWLASSRADTHQRLRSSRHPREVDPAVVAPRAAGTQRRIRHERDDLATADRHDPQRAGEAGEERERCPVR